MAAAGDDKKGPSSLAVCAQWLESDIVRRSVASDASLRATLASACAAPVCVLNVRVRKCD
jgi:hypothetical protein